jgi:hypothetical protein
VKTVHKAGKPATVGPERTTLDNTVENFLRIPIKFTDAIIEQQVLKVEPIGGREGWHERLPPSTWSTHDMQLVHASPFEPL